MSKKVRMMLHAYHTWMTASLYAEDATILIAIMNSSCRVHPMVPVENVEVETGVHPFAWTPCREGASPAHQHVEDCEGDEVRVLVATAFQSQDYMGKLRDGRAGGNVGHVLVNLQRKYQYDMTY